MKKILITLSVALFLFVSGCQQSERVSVAKNFLTALENKDFEEAKKFGTQETAQMLDFLSAINKKAQEELPEEEKEKENSTKFIIVREEKIDDNNVKVFFRKEGEEKESALDLVKVDGKWKVSMKKENPKEEKIKNEGELSHDHNHAEGEHDHDHEHNHDHEH